MEKLQTQTEWEEEMSLKILSFVRNEIYLDLRFLDLALSALWPKPAENLNAFATDGTILYFSTEQVIRVFQSNAPYLDRAYLHSVMHCIFSHLWIGGKRNPDLWGLACDIAVEYTIDQMKVPCTKRILSWRRQTLYTQLLEEEKGISAAVIYRRLQTFTAEELAHLSKEFYTDDHRYWPRQNDDTAKQQTAEKNRDKWNKIARKTRLEREQRGDEKEEGEQLFASQLAAEKSRRSYRDFLQKFSVFREELQADPDEFDINYYTYGLKLYKNMPLIEPLESRENKKIREFVIALDTSYSTSGGLIESFLKETFDILMQKNNFFYEARVHVLLCDNQVQREVTISSEADIKRLMENFTVVGGGGTDFRPVFSYVNESVEKGRIKNLDGLLYFTDGKGIYPTKRPDYKTAFLFLEDYEEENVPPWAIRIKLEPEEFTDIWRGKTFNEHQAGEK